MKISIAKSAGFCFGVKRAIDLALKTSSESDRPVQMLGHIVHNERVVEQIDQAGVQVIDTIEDAIPGILMIRAHGAPPEIYARARERDLELVDATCPLVKEIHEKARSLHEQNYPVIVIGDHGHDEVKGIAAQVPDCTVIASPEEVSSLKKTSRRLGVVVQSTQNVENVKAIIAELVPRCQELRFFNTICFPTTKHQTDIRAMPLNNEVMIIVGSFTSANTKRMTEISRQINDRSYQVTGAEDLKREWFDGVNTVGVHAGASTPDFVIQEVVNGIMQLTDETCEVAEV